MVETTGLLTEELATKGLANSCLSAHSYMWFEDRDDLTAAQGRPPWSFIHSTC